MIGLFLVPHDLAVNLALLRVGLSDAIPSSQVIDRIEQAQLEKLLLPQGYLRIVAF